MSFYPFLLTSSKVRPITLTPQLRVITRVRSFHVPMPHHNLWIIVLTYELFHWL